MIIKILAEGGEMKPGPALSQKLGPAGINIAEVIKKVNQPVELNINPSTKEVEVQVFSPPVSELLKKELEIEKASGLQNKIKVANASIEQIISVAKIKTPNLLCKDLKSSVKTIVGSCVSLGILIENKLATEIEREIQEGKYDKEINQEKTETSDEKKQELKNYFEKIKLKQDKLIKQEQIEKEAKEEKKEEKKEDKPEEKKDEKAKEKKSEVKKKK